MIVLWLSIDPGASAGIARWHSADLHSVATLRPVKLKSERKLPACDGRKFALDVLVRNDIIGRRSYYFHDELNVWTTLLSGQGLVVAEEGFGASATTVKQHAFRRGFIAGLCAERRIEFHEVNVKEWRRVVGKAQDFTFPNNSELAKARAMEVAALKFGADVREDEADAVCAGLWALQTRTVRP